ncbi:pollen-specific leucine-rich repeat extensin-like protein 3 [Iris pallida]|uniref:Pollen-specific leucine-rich repeat extensin-like protein 3 n=1 Tax=Iris pallida TaxID=29817 RepID=A0AAX6G1S4_IRIPA|nr:pollen-specific leucine-rich repeat extensin-like protein 3 [Iris pallida]
MAARGALMVAARPDQRWRHRRGSTDAEIRGRHGEPSGGRGHGAQARRRQIWCPGGFRSGERVWSGVGRWKRRGQRGFEAGRGSTKRRCGGGTERWSAAPVALLCEGRRTLGEMRTGEGFPSLLFWCSGDFRWW